MNKGSTGNKLIIIGGGIIGLTIAREAALSNKFQDIKVFEKEKKLGIHSSTRNSGVIHSGFYYSPNSNRAKFCRKGNELMRDYCERNNLSIRKCGKVVITKNHEEEKTLNQLYERGIKNGVDLKLLEKNDLKKYEPYAKTFENFLWSPNTWSINPLELFICLLDECKELGVQFLTGEKVIAKKNNSIITSNKKKFNFDFLINAAGGFALEIAKLFGLKPHYEVLPFKGLYLKSKSHINKFKKHIYPVPNIKQTFLGIHTTITSDGFLKLGPTAIPVLSPENYQFFEGLDMNIANTIFLQMKLFLNNDFGFRDLAFQEIKYLLKKNIIEKANELTLTDLNEIDFDWYSPGIRPQLFNCRSKKLEDDFVILNEDNAIHLLNSISPAWSASLKTAEFIVQNIK